MSNPLYQSIMSGGMTPVNPIQNLLQRAGQIYQSMQSPQAFVGQYFPFVPENMRNDPNMILQYMQQTGRVTPQQLAFLNQFSAPGR